MMEHAHSPEPDTGIREGWVDIRVRLRPDIHLDMQAVKDRTGQSINSQINSYCEQRLVPAGGAARIGRTRRHLPPRSDPARAALAYLLGYLGRGAEARKAWPWQGRFAVRAGDPEHLIMAGALCADAHDRNGRAAWVTSDAPSGG